jgi:hypothetical protein
LDNWDAPIHFGSYRSLAYWVSSLRYLAYGKIKKSAHERTHGHKFLR